MPRKTRAAAKAEQVTTEDDVTATSPMAEEPRVVDDQTATAGSPEAANTEDETSKKDAPAKKKNKRRKKQGKKVNKATEDAQDDADKVDELEEASVETGAMDVAANITSPSKDTSESTAQAKVAHHDTSPAEADKPSVSNGQLAGTDNASTTASLHQPANAPEAAPVVKTSELLPQRSDSETTSASMVSELAKPDDVPNQEGLEKAEESSAVGLKTAEAYVPVENSVEQAQETRPELPTPPESNADAEEIAPHPGTPQKEQTLLSPAFSATSTQGQVPSKDPIEAMDALADEIEEVQKILPVLDNSPTTPKKPAKSQTNKAREEAKIRASTAQSSKLAAPAQSLTTRGSSTSKLATSTQPSALARSTIGRSVASTSKPTKPLLSQSTISRPRPTSVIGPKTTNVDQSAGTKETKRRPISMSFPAPPPPTKSLKPPTKPSFTLPGDAIAAKLKAQREERQKREEEEERKRREFKARPIGSNLKSITETTVKQTAASRARMSMIASDKEASTTASAKRASLIGNSAQKTATKRSSMFGAPSSSRLNALAAPKRTVSGEESNAGDPAAKPHRTAGLASSTSSLASRATAKSTVSAADMSSQRVKGREVFNRDRVEKETRERERKEKEDKAKKAREEAAERSRQLSREFREKQKRKQEVLAKSKSDEVTVSPIQEEAAKVAPTAIPT